MKTGVLINNYNNGPWLRACLDSVFAQVLPADEVIVFDDGSSDDSIEILRSFGEKIHLVEGVHDYTRSGRASAAAAIAGGFAASSADHLYILDGDDAYLPHHLADYENRWQDCPEAVMIQGPMVRINENGEPVGMFYEERKHRSDYRHDIYRHNETDYFYISSALAYRRDYLEHVLPRLRLDGIDGPADNYLTMHAVFCGPILAVENPSTYYRVRPGSLADLNGLVHGPRINDTKLRILSFNHIAAQYDQPALRPFLNPRYLQQLARHWLPNWMSSSLARLKSILSRRRAEATAPSSGSSIRISVLINNYNNGPWLRDCLDSVLGQTRAADEVIVYDDGSTDGSVQLLRSYGSQIILIEGSHDDNRSSIASQANAVTMAFAVSTGDHIHLLDGDDLYEPNRLELYEEAWAPDTVMMQAPMRLIDEEGATIRESYTKSKQRKNYCRDTYLLNDVHFYYPTSALAFHRDYMAKIIPFDFSSHQEMAADARLSVIAPIWGQVVAREETLSCWRQRTQSMVRSGSQSDPLASTIRRHHYFNHMARLHGFRAIYLALNLRFLRQKARRLLPDWVSAPFVRVGEGRK